MKSIARPVKGKNLAANPNLVPAVVVQGRLYPAGIMGRRSPPVAWHDRVVLQRYGSL